VLLLTGGLLLGSPSDPVLTYPSLESGLVLAMVCSDATTAEKDLSLQDAEALKKQVDRLRRERNSARNDAMRWLEQQQQQQQQQQQWSMPMFMSSSRSLANGNGELGGGGENGDGGDGDGGVDPKTPGRSRGLGARARSAPGMTAGAGGAQEHGEGEHGKKVRSCGVIRCSWRICSGSEYAAVFAFTQTLKSMCSEKPALNNGAECVRM